MTSSEDVAKPFVRIAPPRAWVPLDLRELRAYRDLVYFFAWRDIKVRYKQTALGVGWALLQPLLTMAIFAVIFGKLAGLPSDGVPYPAFTLAALVPWTFFAHALNQSANSLIGSENLLRKVYFPRLVIPISSVIAAAVDFFIALALLAIILFHYRIAPTARLLWLPAFTALAVMTSLAVGLWLAALNVRYRDVRYLLPFLTQAWMFATPIAYSSGLVPERWRALYGINPMAGVVEGFRWSLLGTDRSPDAMIAVSAGITVIALIASAYHFRRMEQTFADDV